MTTDKLYFSPIKECRDDYFIEYRPPIHGYRFATLHLTYTNDFELNLVAKAMETEAKVGSRVLSKKYDVTRSLLKKWIYG